MKWNYGTFELPNQVIKDWKQVGERSAELSKEWQKQNSSTLNSIKKVKTPNINWLSVNVNKNNDLIDNRDDETFYFLHSYFCNIVEKDKILATSNYSGIEFPSIINTKKIYGVQFHPEKSKAQGLNLLKNFASL